MYRRDIYVEFNENLKEKYKRFSGAAAGRKGSTTLYVSELFNLF